ncbi:RidA family protein, partial [Klebsiella pneumoniae]|nr:RidA family protein [Klebsiella pneumoniae]
MEPKGLAGEGGTGPGGHPLPFARAVEAGGWLYVSGQTPVKHGEIVEIGFVDQSGLGVYNGVDRLSATGGHTARG